MEYECPECGFVTPTKGEVSDSSFKPEKDYTYAEYTCPTCNTVLLTTRDKKGTEKTELYPRGAWPRCTCGHPAEYHDNDGFCCGNYEDFKAVGKRGQSSCQCKEYIPLVNEH